MFSNSGSNRKSRNLGCSGKVFGFKISTKRPTVLLRLILTTCVLTDFIYTSPPAARACEIHGRLPSLPSRIQWYAKREYLNLCRIGKPTIAPVNTRRCEHVLLRHVNAPAHVDGKVFLTMATPISIRLQPRALQLLDFTVET